MAARIDTARQRAVSRVSVAAYSACLATIVAGKPRRGSVHSVFATAANVVFPVSPGDCGNFGICVLSLNAAAAPRMPNGLHIVNAPFAVMRPGMSVLLGAHRLCIQPLDIVLDLSYAAQWNPRIERPTKLDMRVVRSNAVRLERYAANWIAPPGYRPLRADYSNRDAMARTLCGRGIGLTPGGDDMLAGWMALGWLLNGPQPDFLAACQQIMTVAKQQTHLLSQCWLGYAADGYVAAPIGALLHALIVDNEPQLALATQDVLAMGATTVYDVIQGILLGLKIACSP